LHDSDVQRINKVLKPDISSFEELVRISNQCIEGVLCEVKSSVPLIPDNDKELQLLCTLIIENCKLRKTANDYAEAINRPTLEKLNDWGKKVHQNRSRWRIGLVPKKKR